MKRIKINPRKDWKSKVEEHFFYYHTNSSEEISECYWDESCYYSFTKDEVNEIYKATNELWEMCLEAVQFVIDQKMYDVFFIPKEFIPAIEQSWENDAPSIYGRFDLVYKNGQIKMLEFNADTPTSLFEGSVVQWNWLQDINSSLDQFNSIHEKLINYWNYLIKYLHDDTLYFTCVRDNLEDVTTVEYLRDCATQAGLKTQFIFIDDIGWDSNQKCFVDLNDNKIQNIFKLYPWEWMVNESFGENILESPETYWIEPIWKMILSNKALLPILWQLFPNHPLLLKSSFCEDDMTSYAKKPILSREGSNVQIVKNGLTIEKTEGEYGEEGFVYQELFELPCYDNNYPVIGSWIIGMEPAGIGIRESSTLITNNTSRFVPHLIEE